MKLPWDKSKQAGDEAEATSHATAVKASEMGAVDEPAERHQHDAELAEPHGDTNEHATERQDADADERQLPKGYTPKKGKPTPKRRDVEKAHGIRRGPVAAPETSKEARARRKQERESMTKEERKEARAKERRDRRRRQAEAQAAMDRGDERYLLARDRGPERALVRDWVDARRFLNNWMMPVLLVLLIVMFIGNYFPLLANVLSIVSLVAMIVLFAEGVLIGRRANRAVRAEFPHTTETGFPLGFYAYSRATQPRKLRTPKPRVALGDPVGKEEKAEAKAEARAERKHQHSSKRHDAPNATEHTPKAQVSEEQRAEEVKARRKRKKQEKKAAKREAARREREAAQQQKAERQRAQREQADRKQAEQAIAQEEPKQGHARKIARPVSKPESAEPQGRGVTQEAAQHAAQPGSAANSPTGTARRIARPE